MPGRFVGVLPAAFGWWLFSCVGLLVTVLVLAFSAIDHGEDVDPAWGLLFTLIGAVAATGPVLLLAVLGVVVRRWRADCAPWAAVAQGLLAGIAPVLFLVILSFALYPGTALDVAVQAAFLVLPVVPPVLLPVLGDQTAQRFGAQLSWVGRARWSDRLVAAATPPWSQMPPPPWPPTQPVLPSPPPAR